MFKKIIFLSSILFGLLFSELVYADVSAQTMTVAAPVKKPVGWWKFNGGAKEGAGKKHGAEKGNPTYTAGVSGQAISFDGKDDFVIVEDDSSGAKTEFGKGSFSIAFWVKSNFVGASNSGIEECIIRNGTDGTEFDSGGAGPGGRASGKRYVIKFKHNKFRFVVGDGSKHIIVEGASSDFATGGWVHVTAVRDTVAHAIRLYCNGRLVNTTVDTTGDISSPGEPLFIGARQKKDAHAANPANSPSGNYFKGMLDEVKIYDYALSQSEIASIAGLSSIQVSLPSAEKLFDVARQYEQAEIYSEAEGVYRQIVKQYPNSPEADKAQLDIPKTQVLSLFVSGRQQEAQGVIDKLIADFSRNSYLPEMLCGVAKEYQDSDEFERAIAIYQKVAAHCSASDYAITAQTHIILSYILMGRIGESKQALNELLEKFQGHSDFPKAIYEVAEPYKEAGEQKQAEALYETIIEDYPDTVHAFKSQKKLAVLYIETGKDARARKAFDKLAKKFSGQPDLPAALERIAGKYEEAGKQKQAKNIYRKITKDYPVTDYAIQAQKKLALIAFEQGNYTEIQEAIDKLIIGFSDRPLAAEAIFILGEQYYMKAFQDEKKDLSEETKANLQRAIDIWGNVTQMSHSEEAPDACYYSADCYHRLGQPSKAMELYQKIVENWPDYEYAWEAQFLIGYCYRKLGETGAMPESDVKAGTKTAYERVLELYPECPAANAARDRLKHNSKFNKGAQK